MTTPETRLITATDAVKAGAAALEDAKNLLQDLCFEEPDLSVQDRWLLRSVRSCLIQAISIVDRCVGGLIRLTDRWQ